MSLEQALRSALATQSLRELDLHFALYMGEFAAQHRDAVMIAAALVSAHTGEGHVCVALEEFAGSVLFANDAHRGVEAPPLSEWRAALRASGVAGGPGDFTPLILDEFDRLYLARYFHFERSIAKHLLKRAEAPLAHLDYGSARARLERYFPPLDGPDQQRLAAAAALLRPLTVIAGGPGTGKTTTVTRLLALFVEQSWPHVPRIALVAPTGKAAARLAESIRAQKAHLDCSDEVREALPEHASTLHRLLGAIPGRSGFRHDARNPLHLDLLVVDEVSMVDVPTMARLLEALPATARLVLLGDPDQLASVEAGSFLGDICNRDVAQGYTDEMRTGLERLGVPPSSAITTPSPLSDSRVFLDRSHRFGEASGIGHLARAINAGDRRRTLEILGEDRADLHWKQLTEDSLGAAVIATSLQEYTAFCGASAVEDALAMFNRFRFLCALRDGPFGVEAMNSAVEQTLRRHGHIMGNERFYAGRPIMITRNDYSLGLFNGDVGLVWPDKDGRLRACFSLPDGSVKRVLLSRLPEHETVFAMTIHKSQGSEFDRCVVVLPDRDAPVLSRELLYTGITRARHVVELWSTESITSSTVARRITRRSGLRDSLWGSSD